VKSFIVPFAWACAALLGSAPVQAAKITAIKLDKGGTALLITGDIENGDGAKFRSEASKYDDGYVLLESDGGSLADAIDIGETIRLKGYPTAVINGSSCNSACALIWLAGTPRALSRSGRIGFHAAYTDSSGSAQESGVANAMVGRYLTLLNLPEKAIIFATSSPPSQLSWLTSKNYAAAGIDVTVIDDIDLHGSQNQTAAVPRPPVIETVTAPPKASSSTSVLWRKLNAWSVYVDPSLRNGCFLLAAYPDTTTLRIGVDASSEDKYYLVFGNTAWASLRPGQKYDVQFKFDQNSPWNVPAKAIKMGTSTMLTADFADAQFWSEFVSSGTLYITRNGEAVEQLNIPGAKAAFEEMVACQKYENESTRPRDPFAQ